MNNTVKIVNRKLHIQVGVLIVAGVLVGCSDSAEVLSESTSGSNEEIQNSDLTTDSDDIAAELALSYRPFNWASQVAAALSPESFAEKGDWGPVKDWPLVATAAANLPDGRVLAWASTSVNGFGGGSGITHSTIYDPLTDNFTSVNNVDHDMFCAGVSMLPDGRVFAAAGGAVVDKVSIFNTVQGEWEPSDSMIFPRWYPTNTTLASGQVFTALGTKVTSAPELWTEGDGWKLVPGASMENIVAQPTTPVGTSDYYPGLYVAPDGTIFHPGPYEDMLTFDIESANALTNHGQRENLHDNRLLGASVMYDEGRILLAGGGIPAATTALTIDVNSASPVVTATNSPSYPRTFQNTLVLPDGKVIMIGGNQGGLKFSDDETVLIPEMWDPETGMWTELAPHSRPRNYHSTALLLPDARVISMGGGLCGGCATNHQNGEIFSPPYLFDRAGNLAARPAINTVTSSSQAGGTLSVSGSNNITQFNFIRQTGTTHHTNTDQRFMALNHSKTGNGRYSVSLPANANILIPGMYWLFGLNANGVPSVGRNVEIGVTTVLVDDSAHIGVEDLGLVRYEYFEGEWENLPNFDALTPVSTGLIRAISLNAVPHREDFFAIRFTTKVAVPVSGEYTFYLNSDDGSAIYVNGAEVLLFDGIHRNFDKSASQFLEAGEYEIVVEYFENSGNRETLTAEWAGPNWERHSFQVAQIPLDTIINTPLPGPLADTVQYNYYEGAWTSLPDFSSLTPLETGSQDAIAIGPFARDDNFGLSLSTHVEIPVSGSYTFYLGSDDGSSLVLDGAVIIDHDGLHRATVKSATLTLAAGTYPMVVNYFELTGDQRLWVDLEGPGVERQLITPFLVSVP